MITFRILLVDDNQLQAATRRAILESNGQVVAVALNGEQALALIDEDSDVGSFGLVITDHLMPVMDGPQLITRLRQQGYRLPVIVLSGLPDAEAAYEGLDVYFRLKPFAPDDLIHLAQDLMGSHMRRSA